MACCPPGSLCVWRKAPSPKTAGHRGLCQCKAFEIKEFIAHLLGAESVVTWMNKSN